MQLLKKIIMVGGFLLNCPVWADDIVAYVNNDIVTRQDVIQYQRKQKQQGGNLTQRAALEQLITNTLQHQFMENWGIKLTNAEVDAAIKHIYQANKMTLAQFNEALAAEGKTLAEFKKQLRQQELQNRFQAAVLGKQQFTVTDAEINNFLKNLPKEVTENIQYHLEDLLLPITDDEQHGIKKYQSLLAEIRKAWRTATDNAALLKRFNAKLAATEQLQITDLEWRTVAQLPNVFIPQVLRLASKEVSAPISAGNGIHLLKLIEKRGEVSRARVKEILLAKKRQQAVDKFLQEARKQAFIKIKL